MSAPQASPPPSPPAPYRALVDDAAVFPPGNSPLDDAVAAWTSRRGTPVAALVGSFVVADQRLADVAALVPTGDEPLPVSVVVGTGAGGIGPAASSVRRHDGLRLAGLEVALRDPDDLAGNARRVVTAVDQARAAGVLDDEVPVYVELPQTAPTPGWLAAADEVAASELRLKLRTGGVDADLFPSAGTLAAWIDAALDRETPFKCTAGLHHAVRRHDTTTDCLHHGFLNVLAATRACFDGAPADEVVGLLEQQDAAALVATWHGFGDAAAGTRRWFTGFGSCSVQEPWDDLAALGLLDEATTTGDS